MADLQSILKYAHLLVDDVLPLAIRGATSAVGLWRDGTQRIEQMVAEQREPTPEEWDDLNSRRAAMQSDLHTDDPDEVS